MSIGVRVVQHAPSSFSYSSPTVSRASRGGLITPLFAFRIKRNTQYMEVLTFSIENPPFSPKPQRGRAQSTRMTQANYAGCVGFSRKKELFTFRNSPYDLNKLESITLRRSFSKYKLSKFIRWKEKPKVKNSCDSKETADRIENWQVWKYHALKIVLPFTILFLLLR